MQGMRRRSLLGVRIKCFILMQKPAVGPPPSSFTLRKGVLPCMMVVFLFLETFKKRMETLAQALTEMIPVEREMFC